MKRLIAVLMAAALFAAVPALAQDPGHVKIAPNNIGDLLIFPFYYTDDSGIATKLTVVNTSETKSTVAKVVIKTWAKSKEVRDFLIYLSPADVWTGYIVSLGGTVYLVSFDDSMHDENGRWGSADNPVKIHLQPADKDDTNWLGYVYVINAATDTDTDGAGDDRQRLGGAPGILKAKIYDWYYGFEDSDKTNLKNENEFSLYTGDQARPENILAGWMELTYGYLYNISGLNATTLADYQNRAYISAGDTTLLSRVFPDEDGDQYGGSYARNSLSDIEAVLAKIRVAMPYVKGAFDLPEFTVHMFTFPTKDIAEGVRSPFFKPKTEKDPMACISVDRKIYDLTERSVSRAFSPPLPADDFCNEVQYIFTDNFPFSEGWARYTFPKGPTTDNNTIWNEVRNNSTLTYEGTPVIPTLFDITFGEVFTSLRYGAWDDPSPGVTVSDSVGGTVYPVEGFNDMVNYKYSNIPYPSEFTP
ncbi:MAG: hypothetical protein WHS46_00240 [Desulfosoma sp.]